MNFIELGLVAIQLFNIDSILIDRLYLSPQKHRWLLTEVLASSRLSCTRFEKGVEGNSRCERFRRKRRKFSTSINIVERSGGYPEVTMHVDRSSATASSASICRFSSSSCHFWKGELQEMVGLFPFYSQGASAGKISSRRPFERFRPSASSSGPPKSFKPKKTWTNTFICVCESDQLVVPSREEKVRPSSFFSPFSVVRPTQIFGIFDEKKK